MLQLLLDHGCDPTVPALIRGIRGHVDVAYTTFTFEACVSSSSALLNCIHVSSDTETSYRTL